jgi:O-acetyl-ADP-ribose deacetylase (regulator of RNase III)
MKVEVLAGNILDVPADVLVSTANPWLQMTGGAGERHGRWGTVYAM